MTYSVEACLAVKRLNAMKAGAMLFSNTPVSPGLYIRVVCGTVTYLCVLMIFQYSATSTEYGEFSVFYAVINLPKT